MRKALCIALIAAMSAVGCTDGWVKVLLADLPTITQVAINIAQLASLASNQGTADTVDAANITAFSQQATAALNLIDSAYQVYEANKTSSNLQNIVVAANTANTDIVKALAIVHVKDQRLQTEVVAASGIITSTVATIIALIPNQTTSVTQAVSKAAIFRKAGPKLPPNPPAPAVIKARWNAEVCGGSAGCPRM